MLSSQVVRGQDVVDELGLVGIGVDSGPDVLSDHGRRQIDQTEQRSVGARLPTIGMQERQGAGEDRLRFLAARHTARNDIAELQASQNRDVVRRV